jgi:beta-lactamase regulating signal transducer with metallopeptidase domain
MTVSAFLLLLVKVNLAMAAAIVLLSLLRRPLRLSFGAPIAYAAWLLVPVAGVASLLPPRVAAAVPARIAPVQIAEQLTGQVARAATEIAAPISAYHLPVFQMPGTALSIFAAWLLGTALMALYLTRLQLRFTAAMRRGEAGPAVHGFFRPRIVMPSDFQEQFSPQEQAAILAHEEVHLARQDARINALAALLRCLCWFNPLIYLGTGWLRIDQELACDATAVALKVSRSDYAKALLKSQMIATALPVGCNWPGSQHPLIERVVLLNREPASPARRLAGTSLVILATGFTGLGAWAAQPPNAARSVAAQQLAHANPLRDGNIETPKNIRADSSRSAVPAPVDRPTAREAGITAGPEAAPAVVHQTSSTFSVASDQPATMPEGSAPVDCRTLPVLQGIFAGRHVELCRVDQVKVIEKHVIVN